MYYASWGLVRSPFAGHEAASFFLGEPQSEALARLRFASRQRRHAVLQGRRGVGKTSLLAQFADGETRAGRAVLEVNAAGLSPRELLWRVVGGLSLAPRPDDDAARLFRRLEDAVAGPWALAAGATLLLDDADQAGPDTLAQIKRLAWLGSGPRGMNLILAASLPTCHRLDEGLLDLLDMRIDLECWSEPDTTGYLQHAILEAGGDRPIFEEEALSALYSLTEGTPRKVNRLADHALLGAAAEGSETVDAAMIEAAYDALSWVVIA